MLSSSTSLVPFMWMMETRTSRVREDVGCVGGGGGGGGGDPVKPKLAASEGAGASSMMAGSPSAGTVATVVDTGRDQAQGAREPREVVSRPHTGGHGWAMRASRGGRRDSLRI
jgi:hypothetical protein